MKHGLKLLAVGYILLAASVHSLETVIDQHLCQEALRDLLPPGESSRLSHTQVDHIVSALVQVDNTFGITPCQYSKLKGMAVHPDNNGMFLPPSGMAPITPNPAAQAIQSMYDASGEAGYGHDRVSAAERAGQSVGKGLNAGIEGINVGIKGINVGIDAIRDFKIGDIGFTVAGKWINKAGEAVGDVVTESTKATYDFFKGVGESLGPSTAGRRRVVYDKDCDFIQHGIDSIENNCAQYRFDKMKFMYPFLQAMGDFDVEIVGNRSRINATVAGDPTSLDTGMREVFGNQRDALYGQNGTCLQPTRGSISMMEEQLDSLVFEINKATAGSFDTHWSNLMNIDGSIKNATIETVHEFTEGVLDTFNISIAAQGLISRMRSLDLNGAYSASVALLKNLSDSIMALQGKVDDRIARAQESGNKLANNSAKSLGRLEAKMDSVVNLMDISPSGLDRFTDSLSSGVWKILRAANQSSQADTRDLLLNSLGPNAKKLIDQFGDQSGTFLTDSRKDWTGYTDRYSNSYKNTYRSRDGQVSDATANISQSFDATDADIQDEFLDMSSSQSIKLGDVERSARTLAQAGQSLQAKQRAAAAAVKALFRGLISGNSNTIADTQTKIGQIVGIGSQGSGEQLSVASQQVSGLGQSLSDSSNDLSSSLTNLVYKLRSLIADSVNSANSASADQEDSLRSASDLSQSKVQLVADSSSLSSTGATDDWHQMGDDAVSGLEDVVSEADLERARTRRDSQQALSALGSESSEGSFESEMTADRSSSNARSSLVAAGSSIDGLSQSAGQDLAAQQSVIASNLGEVGRARDSIRDASQTSVAQASTLFDSLSNEDSDAATQFSSSTRTANLQAGSDIDKSVSKMESLSSHAATDISNRLANIVGQVVDGTSEKLESAMTATSNTEVGLSALSDQLDSLPQSATEQQRAMNSSVIQSLDSVVSKSESFAQSVGADLSSKQADIVSDVQSSVFKLSSNADGFALVSSKAGSAIDAQSRAYSQTVTSDALLKNVLRLMGDSTAAVSQELAKDVDQSGADEHEFSNDVTNVKSALINLNTSASNSLSDIVGDFLKFNASYPDKLSKAVQEYIDSLGADGMRLMDAIAGAAKTTAGTGFAASLNDPSSASVMDDASNVGSDYLSQASQNQDDLIQTSQQTSGRLNGVSSEIDKAKKYLKDNADQAVSYRDYMDASARRADMESTSVTGQLSSVVHSTNSSLSLLAGQEGTESGFASNMNKAQSSSMLTMGDVSAKQTAGLSRDVNAAVASTVGEASSSLNEVQSDMERHGAELRAKTQAAWTSVASSDSTLIGNISSDRSQVDLQLMMAKRSLRTLLSAWEKYASTETRKFQKMNSTDNEYMSLTPNRISTANDTSGGSLRTSLSNMNGLNDQVVQAVMDYLGFGSTIRGNLDGYRQGLHALNVSTDSGVSQIKEMIYNLNANDEFLDSERRGEMTTVIDQFNAELDKRASEAQQSIIGS